MEQAFDVLAADEPDSDLATLAHELARLYMFTGNAELHAKRVELALDIAETLELPEIVSQALNTKSIAFEHRPYESGALIREALRIALDHDLTSAALRAYNNLAYLGELHDQTREARAACENGIALARRRGDRNWEWILLSNLISNLYRLGDWDEALALAADIPVEAMDAAMGNYPTDTLAQIHIERGSSGGAGDDRDHLGLGGVHRPPGSRYRASHPRDADRCRIRSDSRRAHRARRGRRSRDLRLAVPRRRPGSPRQRRPGSG